MAVVDIIRLQPSVGVAAVEMVLALLEIPGRQSTTGGYCKNSEEDRPDSRSGLKAHAIIYCTFQISIDFQSA